MSDELCLNTSERSAIRVGADRPSARRPLGIALLPDAAAFNDGSEWIVAHSYKAQIDPAAPVTS